MTHADKQRQIQESRYRFPYHYIPSYEDSNFTQTRVLRWGYEYLAYLRFVLDRIRTLAFDSLLDVGCGDGRFLFELRKILPEKKLVGIDPSETAIHFARTLCPEVKWVCGDIRSGVQQHERFDLLTLIEVLEHISTDTLPDFVKALHDRLETDGLLVLTVPSMNVEVARKHYQHFDPESLREALQPWFSISECHFLNRISPGTKWMERLLVNKWFILNHQGLLNWLYRRYEKRSLKAEAHNAKRICAICQRSRVA